MNIINRLITSYKILLMLHAVCVGSRDRKRELITISDDSDEEPVTLVPGSPVLVPDDADDDDIRILEVTVSLKTKVLKYKNVFCSTADVKSEPIT